MRYFFTTAILLFATAPLFGQEMTGTEIENDLVKTYKLITDNRLSGDSINDDKLETDNKSFKEKIEGYTRKFPQTLTYDFNKLKKEGSIFIASSTDKRLRIYSWNTWQGGTMVDFRNVFQFESEGKVLTDTTAVSVEEEEEDMNDAFFPFYDEIVTLDATNGKRYYMTIGNSVFSSKDVRIWVNFLTIEKGKLNHDNKLIKTKKGFESELVIDYDFFTVMDRKERPIRLVDYDAKTKLLKVAIVYEDGKVTDRFIVYKFNGSYFEHFATQKPKAKSQKRKK